jgi:tetratricopeptide (TPR) repeat protein
MADAHYNLANLLLDMGRFSQAIAHYKQAMEVSPNFEKARLGLQQAEAALKAESGEKPAAAAGDVKVSNVNLERNLDPVIDGPVLTALHKATIVFENYGRDFVKILESDIEPAIKELSSTLLYPDKASGELSERLERFEAAMDSLRAMQKNLQVSMKKLKEINERLLTTPTASAEAPH